MKCYFIQRAIHHLFKGEYERSIWFIKCLQNSEEEEA